MLKNRKIHKKQVLELIYAIPIEYINLKLIISG